MTHLLEVGAPAMRVIVGRTRFQNGRRVVRTHGCRRTTHLHDDRHKKHEPFKHLEVHVPIKENLRPKGKHTVTFS